MNRPSYSSSSTLTSQRQWNSTNVRALTKNIDAQLAAQQRELPLVVDVSGSTAIVTSNNNNNNNNISQIVKQQTSSQTKELMSPPRNIYSNVADTTINNTHTNNDSVKVGWNAPSLSELMMKQQQQQQKQQNSSCNFLNSVVHNTEQSYLTNTGSVSLMSPPSKTSSSTSSIVKVSSSSTTTSNSNSPNYSPTQTNFSNNNNNSIPVSISFPEFDNLKKLKTEIIQQGANSNNNVSNNDQNSPRAISPWRRSRYFLDDHSSSCNNNNSCSNGNCSSIHQHQQHQNKTKFENTTPSFFLPKRAGSEHRGIDSISMDKLVEAVEECPNRDRRIAATQALVGTSLDRGKIFSEMSKQEEKFRKNKTRENNINNNYTNSSNNNDNSPTTKLNISNVSATSVSSSVIELSPMSEERNYSKNANVTNNNNASASSSSYFTRSNNDNSRSNTYQSRNNSDYTHNNNNDNSRNVNDDAELDKELLAAVNELETQKNQKRY